MLEGRGAGLKPGDLEPGLSPYPLTTHKAAYMKLRGLVDLGCVLVGHGLKQDFRMVNIYVPPSQVRPQYTSPALLLFPFLPLFSFFFFSFLFSLINVALNADLWRGA